MTSHQLDEEAIFDIARKLPEGEDRGKYLSQVCAGDQALRERVEALLTVHEQEQEFLKSNPEPAPTVDQPAPTEDVGQQIGRYKLLQQIGGAPFGEQL